MKDMAAELGLDCDMNGFVAPLAELSWKARFEPTHQLNRLWSRRNKRGAPVFSWRDLVLQCGKMQSEVGSLMITPRRVTLTRTITLGRGSSAGFVVTAAAGCDFKGSQPTAEFEHVHGSL